MWTTCDMTMLTIGAPARVTTSASHLAPILGRIDSCFDQREAVRSKRALRGTSQARDVFDDHAVAAVGFCKQRVVGAAGSYAGFRKLHALLLQLDQRQRVVAE